MKIIPVQSQAFGYQEILVDDEDYQKVCQYNWYISQPSKTFYAYSTVEGERISMHRYLMKPDESFDIDHLDHNGLNNQRNNLRTCTRSENMQNLPVRGVSSFKGVSISVGKQRWYSRIKCARKSYWCGQFPLTPCGEILAAIAYDTKALELFGPGAILNFK